MKHVHPEFQPILTAEGIHSFDDVWSLERNWFEDPNMRRGGMSGVCRKVWQNPASGLAEPFFIKLQENHCYRNWRHPLRGSPTARREALNLLMLEAKGFPTQTLAWYGEKKVEGRQRAVLITRELPGKSLFKHLKTAPLDDALAAKIAGLVWRLNGQVRYEHRALLPKHIWINEGALAMIDLEHARPRWCSRRSAFDDIKNLVDTLQELKKVTAAQRLEVLRQYLRLAGRLSRLDRLAARCGLNDAR